MYEDKTLVCKDCGKEFVFTAGEQEFYAEKGFQNRFAARNAAMPARPAVAPTIMARARCTRPFALSAAARRAYPLFPRTTVPSIAASASRRAEANNFPAFSNPEFLLKI